MSVPIAFITAEELPKPDQETELLAQALAQLGLATTTLAWTEPHDWSAFSLVVLRTPWDYFRRVDQFLAWAKGVDQVTKLVNPYEVIQWNSHKRYLLELAQRGVPIVPTVLVNSGTSALSLSSCFSASELVVKPTVGIGAFGAKKGGADDVSLLSHAQALLNQGDILVQPFVPSIAARGEVSLLYFGGEYSHAVRKVPLSGDYRVQDEYGGTVQLYQPTAAELQVAAQSLAAAPGPALYARVDLVDWDSQPVLMELELIEPELFIRFLPASVSRLAERIRDELV